MGRDVTGLRSTEKKSSPVTVKSNGTVHVAPKATPEKVETKDSEPEGHSVKSSNLSAENNEKPDVLGIKSTNHEPEEKVIKADVQKSTDKTLRSPVKRGSASAVGGSDHANSVESPTSAEKQASLTDHANGVDSNDSPKSGDLHSPKTDMKSQTNSPFMSRKQLQPSDKKYYDEEDNWSLASSTATSRTARVTVPVAPKFTCVDRLQRRKEFYTKLEEKHKALEKERQEYEARTKEEEQAAIRQLRKSMVVKANPVPKFYKEGPPPKVELKKLPVTRAKSPNLSRRKSCGDVAKPSPPEEKEKGSCGRATRHSVGIYREVKNSPITPKTKDRVGVRKSNGTTTKVKGRTQQPKETLPSTTDPATENSQVEKQESAEIPIES